MTASVADGAMHPLDAAAMPRTSNKPPRLNQIGQRIGAKGERTRQKLIDVTVSLLESHGMRDLTVAEVARVAETSPATFYVYFDSVQAVVLGALERAPHSNQALLDLMCAPWNISDAPARAIGFVRLYTDLWNRHGTIFRVRNMAAEEGDQRFLAARSAAALPMLESICQTIEQGQAAGRIPLAIHAASAAGVMLSMLERLSSVGPKQPYGPTHGITYDRMREAAAHTLVQFLGLGQ